MTLTKHFSCDQEAELVLKLSREILGDECLVIQTVNFKLLENFETSSAKLEARIIEVGAGEAKKRNIQGEGVGLIDACFEAMIHTYEGNYCSLDNISLVDFKVIAHIDHDSHKRKSDASVTAILRIKNTANHEYVFEYTTASISRSSVAVAQEAVAFFINAELAFKKLYQALKNAKERGRQDLIERFQSQMATLVKATSYEKLVQRINN